jgi:hypothetical protein
MHRGSAGRIRSKPRAQRRPTRGAPIRGGGSGEALAHQPVALGDQRRVPGPTVLFVEGDQFAPRRDPGGAAGLGEEHQRQQPGCLTVVRQERTDQAREPDRLGGQVVTYGISVGAGRQVALERPQPRARPVARPNRCAPRCQTLNSNRRERVGLITLSFLITPPAYPRRLGADSDPGRSSDGSAPAPRNQPRKCARVPAKRLERTSLATTKGDDR